MAKPILTLTTDFGLADQYVGVMKGVILGICPQAQLVDISHEAKPFCVPDGAYLIAQAYRYFPPKTVHVVVVDPGVGTSRRPILLEAAGQYFVAPDNGVLSMIYSAEKHKIRLISAERYFRNPVSRTFHGRDIFAPVAAHVAAGVPPSRMGKLIDDYLRPGFGKPRRVGKRTWSGEVLRIDRFGNIITNFHASDFPDLEKRTISLAIGPVEIPVLAHTYSEAGPGELFLIFGSSGYLEVSLNEGSAAKKIVCEAGESADLMIW
jgi:S-adenosyl-L-methionine hydrolase (adenosine-forming)